MRTLRRLDASSCSYDEDVANRRLRKKECVISKHKKERREDIRYEDVFTYSNLLSSHLKSRRGKRTRETNIKYDAYQKRNLYRLRDKLLNGTYKIKDLYSFTILEPKERSIVANQYEDKIVQRCICDYILEPAISPKLIFDNYASQPGKGTDLARERFENNLRSFIKKYHSNEGYILQIDIKGYFSSIDREILCSMVDKLNLDDRCKEIIRMEIYAYDKDSDKGVCIGFQSMQWLAVFYLNGLDHYIKETLRAKYYGRYMDDLYVIHNDLDVLNDWYAKITDYLNNKLKLELNKKSKIRKLSNNILWLGFRYRINGSNTILCRVNKDALSRYIRRLKKYYREFNNSEIGYETISASMNSWRAHLMKCSSPKRMLKVLDNKIIEIFGREFFDRFVHDYGYPTEKRKKKK